MLHFLHFLKVYWAHGTYVLVLLSLVCSHAQDPSIMPVTKCMHMGRLWTDGVASMFPHVGVRNYDSAPVFEAALLSLQ